MLSSRPPPPLSSSMEVIPKRYRSGSISSRLRSASELFDEGVIVDRQQKGVFKDLIISGDEALAEALARYERGDKEPIKTLLREGVLNRKSSLDLLGEVGDLSFDFLSVSATTTNVLSSAARANLDTPFPMDEEEMTFEILLQESSDAFSKSPPKKFLSHGSFSSRAQMGLRSASLSSVHSTMGAKSGAFMGKSGNGNNTPHLTAFSSLGTPPPDLFEISILDESGVGAWAHPAFRGGNFSSMRGIKEVLEFDSDDLGSPMSSPQDDSYEVMPKAAPKPVPTAPPLPKSRRQAAQLKARVDSGSASATSAPIVIPRTTKTHSTTRAAASAASTKRISASTAAQQAPVTPLTAEERAATRRAQGIPMIGAYSPDSRKMRVERFVAKRDRRVWKKKVKYDVRKNFADSRLRVKGRFVKKEDEEMLRDLMTMV